MYFKKKYITNISKIISNEYKFYAHLNKGKYEKLEEHTNKAVAYFEKIIESKKIDNIFLNFESLYLKNNTDIELFRELMINSIPFHDLGKINPNYQNIRLNNPIYNNCSFSKLGTRHSIISSVLYIDYFLDRVIQSKSFDLLQILFINSYIISRHHSGLDSFYNFLNKFNPDGSGYEVIKLFSSENILNNKEFSLSIRKINNIVKAIKNIETSKEKSIYLYAYTKLLYSLLVASDFYATSEFMNGVKINEFGEINDIDKFSDIYEDTELYKKIKAYEKNHYNKEKDLSNEKDIDILRTELFLDSEKALIKNINEDIFFLEAPTGSGKSNVAINLSFKVLKENKNFKKIYYIYPFNTLVEQNLCSLEKIFGKNADIFNKIAVINSITPIKLDIKEMKDSNSEDNYRYYEKALLDRQFLNYPMILSTHVSLFDTLFNPSKESSFSFYQLANSVIVLDEIQSYKNVIWAEIISFLKYFSKLLNIKVIIMSATLPNLRLLIDNKENIVDLITDREKYFNNNLFKNRVTISYELLSSKNIIHDLFNHVKKNSANNKKILIEFITKESAYNFYNILKEDNEIKCEIKLLTGDDNIIERKKVLDYISSEETRTNGVILVATQLIEAGVDIDMDIGYKNISMLDLEEQFAGRINRSCKAEGILYLFILDEAQRIYKNDVRSQPRFTVIEDDMKKILNDKDFNTYYSNILKNIKEIYNNSLSCSNLEEFFCNVVAKLDCNKISERMKLIDDNDWKMSIYLSRIIKDEKGIEIDGTKIWNEYKSLLNNKIMNYSKKRVELSEVKKYINYFKYEIKKNDNLIFNERVGELYFIENGDDYFDNGKLIRDKLIDK